MPRSSDVTAELLAKVSGPGETVKRFHAAKAAKALTPPLAAELEAWNRQSDKSIGYVSNALAYGFRSFMKPSVHSRLIRLIKGGFLRVCQIDAKPPQGSNAAKGSPYGDRYYLVRESCPSEVYEGQLHGSRPRARKRRR